MTVSRKTKLKDIHPLSHLVATMYDKRVFDVLQLRRKFSKHLEINVNKDRNGIHENRFSITSRKTGHYVACSYDFTLNADARVIVTHSTVYGSKLTVEFNVSNNKQLMQKLFHYKLLE